MKVPHERDSWIARLNNGANLNQPVEYSETIITNRQQTSQGCCPTVRPAFSDWCICASPPPSRQHALMNTSFRDLLRTSNRGPPNIEVEVWDGCRCCEVMHNVQTEYITGTELAVFMHMDTDHILYAELIWAHNAITPQSARYHQGVRAFIQILFSIHNFNLKSPKDWCLLVLCV